MRDGAKEGHRIEGLKPEVDDFSSLVVRSELRSCRLKDEMKP